MNTPEGEVAVRLDRPRVDPLPEDEWDDDTRELLGAISLGGAEPLNIFTTLARHPKLLKRWLVFGNHVLFKSTLPARERELAILRTGWLCGAEYEWGQHVVIARELGLGDDEIAAIAEGPSADRWSETDRALLAAADELHADSLVSDATWNELAAAYDAQQLMDLVFTIGQYTLVSMALNTLGVQLDEGFGGFPS